MLQGQEHDQPQPQTSPQEAPEDAADNAPRILCDLAGSSSFDGLIQSLEAHGLRSVRALDDLASELLQHPSARGVIVFPNPVLFLGEQLERGQALDDAIRIWLASTERVLAQFRRDRRRITLLDGHAALRSPALMKRLLCARLSLDAGLADGDDFSGTDPNSGVPADTAGMPHLIAAQALRQDEDTAVIFAELEASSLPLGPAYQVDVNAIVADGLTSEKASELEAQREKNELLLLQLQQVQEELEAYALENSKLKNEQESGGPKVKQARLARDSAKAELREAREAWQEERKLLTNKLKWTADDLAAVRRSLSWRLTAPLREVLGLFVGKSKL